MKARCKRMDREPCQEIRYAKKKYGRGKWSSSPKLKGVAIGGLGAIE